MTSKSQRLDIWEVATIEQALEYWAYHNLIGANEFTATCLDQLRSKLTDCDGIRLVKRSIAGSPRLERMAVEADAMKSQLDDIL